MNFFNLTGEKKQKKQNNERKTPTYAQNYNNTVKTVNNAIKNSKRETPTYVNNYNNTVKNTNKKLGINNEVKRTSRNQKIDTNTNLNNTRENITLNKAQEYKKSNKAQEKAYKDYTRNDFKNDNDYERFLTENKVSLTSGNALDYINKKAQEQGVSARDFAKGMHTKVNNTLETEKLEQKAKNGELSDNDMNSLSQFHAYVDSNNNVIDDEKLQNQADLYKNTVDTINNDVNKLNEQYQKGKIGIDEYQNKYSQLEERWNTNQELGKYLDNVSLKTGFDYYNWAKENNLDVSEFEKYAESFNDSMVERLTEDFAAATTDLINTPVQLYDMAKSIVDKDFNMLDEDNASTQMANESAKLRNYVMAGTNGAGRITVQIVDSLMPMAVNALTFNVLGTALGIGGQLLTSFTNNLTNVSLGAQVAGQTARQRLEEGNSVGSSVVNGIAHGAITGLVEGLDAGKVASIFTGEAKNYILGTALLGKASFNNVAKFLNAVGSSEGAEEVIETFADWGADHVQNLIGRTIFKENYDPVEVTQLDPQEMAQEYALAYAGAFVLGASRAVGVAVNSKKTYNAAIEARNYAESVLNSPIADEGSKRIAELTIQAIDDDINNYNQTKTPLSDGVTFESEKAQPLGTFDEALENLVQATRLDIKDNLAQTVGLMENLQKTSGLIQKGLYERGININAFDYMNLPSETKQNVKSLMKTINNMDGGFPYKVAFDGSLDSSINGYIKDGKIVLNPNIDNNYQSVLSHEITHTLENSKNYQNIKNLIKESSDYQEYYDKYSKLYKGVADDVDSEVMAKYIENNLGNKGLIDKLVKYDESLGYRIFENLKSNLSSDLDTKVENSWLKAFKETKRSTHSGLQYDTVDHFNKNGDILSKEQIESRTQQQFKQTVKDIVQNKNNDTNNAILVSEYSPDWMIKSGYNDKPLLITKKHIESAMGLGNSRNLHNVSEKVVSELPSLIKDPIAVLNYRGNDLLAILKATDKDGNILITAIKPDGTGTYNNIEIDSNFIKSLYGKDSVVRYLDKVIDDKNVVYSNVGNSKVAIAKEIMNYQQVSDYMKKGSTTPELQSLDRNTSFESNLPKNSEEVNFFDTNDKNLKAKQLEIIQNNNPDLDDYHTWIRSVEDIKTFEETLNDSDYKEYFDSGEDFDESYTNKMAKDALEKGSIRVYSSYPIKDGIFVTPSIMEAQSYSGDGKVYSKIVNLNDVAWVDPTQGQYAKVSGDNASKTKFSLNDKYQGIDNINEVNGENSTLPPYRNSEIPSYNETGKVSKGAKTIADSYLVSDETSNKIIERAKQGKLNTRGYTNERVESLVDEKINELKTFDNCYDFVMGKVTVEDGAVAHALGTRLIQSVEAQIDDLKANNGDTNTIKNLQKTVDNLSTRTIQLSSASGDTVRQHATFKGMTKEGQIEFIKESIQDIQDQLNRQRKGEAPTLELKQEFIDEWNNATTEEQKQEVAEKIVQDIGSQIPPTITDQLNAWRHLSMLFNPRTWIKNYLANIVSGQVATLKQTIQTGIEGIMFARENPSEAKINDFIKNEENIKKANELGISPSDYAKMELGKHAGVYNPISDRALLNELVKDYDNNYKNFKTKYAGGDISTYIGSGEFAQSVNEARKQFSSDTLNKLVDIQAKFMSDAPAMRKAYAKTMIGWLKANNLTFDNLTKEQLAYARDYAFNQARIITFNEESKMAKNIVEVSNKNLAIKLIVDSMVPFKRTPINILKQGVNYSPVGLLKTITYNTYQLSKGEITTSKFTSNLASGLTGAGVMGLGYILAKMGIFRTTDDDNKKKKNFDKDNGEQNYAIVTPNGTYTIDWLDPFIMPLSMGAEVANSDSVLSADDAFNLFLAMENPVFETSMLSGIRKPFQGYDEKESGWFNNVVATITSNYVSQYVPTIFGAAARTIDDTRRTTYPNEGTIDKATKTIVNKIPFLSKTNQPYVNKQGQEQKNEDLGMGALGRAFLNFVSPGYYSSKKIDKYDEELYRLYSETGVSTVLPSDSTKSVEYGGDTYKLLGEDYTNWNKTRLSTETDFVNKFIDSEEYSNYDDSQKAKIIGDIRTYAGQKAKKEFLENNNVEYDDTAYKKASEALQNDLELYQYYGANDYYNDLSGDDKKGSYLDYIKGLETSSKGKNYLYDTKYGDTKLNSYINDMGIDDDQKFAAKEVNAKAQSAKDSNGKTISNSKALAVAKGYEDAGILDDVFEYIEKNGLEPKDVGLTKTVSKYTEDEILEAYEEIFGSGGTISSKNAKSSRNGSKSSSSKVSSNATTAVKAQARLGTNTSTKKSQNYSNVDYISAYLNALEKKNKELQNKYSEKLYE